MEYPILLDAKLVGKNTIKEIVESTDEIISGQYAR